MTFVEDVTALRHLLGVAHHLELQPAISAMNLAMGIDGGGSLPNQVAKIIAETGMDVATPAPVDDRRFLAPQSPKNRGLGLGSILNV